MMFSNDQLTRDRHLCVISSGHLASITDFGVPQRPFFEWMWGKAVKEITETLSLGAIAVRDLTILAFG